MTERPGLLTRWDKRNQRILERANERDREAHGEFFAVRDGEGRQVTITVNRAGYPVRSLGELDLALLPFRWAIGWLRNRFVFKGAHQVEVLRERRWVGLEKIVAIERLPTRADARARARSLADEFTGSP